MNIINPATEKSIAIVQEDTISTLALKFKNLTRAQKMWSMVPLEERVKIIERFIELMKANIESLASILTSEMGKPLQQSRNEINGASGKASWLAEHSVQYLSAEIMSISDQMTEKIVYEPLGVVCNISAWNYPYNVGVNIFIPALLAGNAVMYKPSEFATLTGIEIGKLLHLAGLPTGVFEVAIGMGNVGQMLLDLRFDGYFFTGSYKTGRQIYDRIAEKMVPCIMELGGKDPVYVTDDVHNIQDVAAGIADGAFYNNGQSCCSVERIYVHAAIYDAFVEAFVAEVKSWKTGEPTEDGVYISTLTREAQLDFLNAQVADALSKGAHLMTGGRRMERVGYYFEPTVLVQASHDMLVMQEESFGPIIGIMRVESDLEATNLMNDTVYGLTASVYSASQVRAEKILSQIDAGTGYWNCCDRVSAALPWSGRGHSGFGVSLSHVGIRAFTKTKSYHLRSLS